jgi:hypothetical protein
MFTSIKLDKAFNQSIKDKIIADLDNLAINNNSKFSNFIHPKIHLVLTSKIASPGLITKHEVSFCELLSDNKLTITEVAKIICNQELFFKHKRYYQIVEM